MGLIPLILPGCRFVNSLIALFAKTRAKSGISTRCGWSMGVWAYGSVGVAPAACRHISAIAQCLGKPAGSRRCGSAVPRRLPRPKGARGSSRTESNHCVGATEDSQNRRSPSGQTRALLAAIRGEGRPPQADFLSPLRDGSGIKAGGCVPGRTSAIQPPDAPTGCLSSARTVIPR